MAQAQRGGYHPASLPPRPAPAPRTQQQARGAPPPVQPHHGSGSYSEAVYSEDFEPSQSGVDISSSVLEEEAVGSGAGSWKMVHLYQGASVHRTGAVLPAASSVGLDARC